MSTGQEPPLASIEYQALAEMQHHQSSYRQFALGEVGKAENSNITTSI
jgi:hypothetical protein